MGRSGRTFLFRILFKLHHNGIYLVTRIFYFLPRGGNQQSKKVEELIRTSPLVTTRPSPAALRRQRAIVNIPIEFILGFIGTYLFSAVYRIIEAF